jgi:hypothetical protein
MPSPQKPGPAPLDIIGTLPVTSSEQGIPLQLIMAKTRHRNPRTAMRYVRPGAEAVAEITTLLEPPRRRG